MPSSTSQEKDIDIVAFGISAVDDLIELERFPRPGAKEPVLAARRQCGGNCTNALLAAARLGMRCLYGGHLGRNELSDCVRETLGSAGIEFPAQIAFPEARPIHSRILIERSSGERTILYSKAGVVEPRPDNLRAGLIARGRLLLADDLGPEGTRLACQMAREAGMPVVADIEQITNEATWDVMALADHLIIPLAFAVQLTGQPQPEEAVIHLAASGRALTAVTGGARGCWFVKGEEKMAVRHQPAFEVKVADTTGCGDVFHGAYAAALLLEMAPEKALRFAAAAAALRASRFDGQLGLPDRSTVEEFLARQPAMD
jgi:sulfofructose kinase